MNGESNISDAEIEATEQALQLSHTLYYYGLNTIHKLLRNQWLIGNLKELVIFEDCYLKVMLHALTWCR